MDSLVRNPTLSLSARSREVPPSPSSQWLTPHSAASSSNTGSAQLNLSAKFLGSPKLNGSTKFPVLYGSRVDRVYGLDQTASVMENVNVNVSFKAKKRPPSNAGVRNAGARNWAVVRAVLNARATGEASMGRGLHTWIGAMYKMETFLHAFQEWVSRNPDVLPVVGEHNASQMHQYLTKAEHLVCALALRLAIPGINAPQPLPSPAANPNLSSDHIRLLVVSLSREVRQILERVEADVAVMMADPLAPPPNWLAPHQHQHLPTTPGKVKVGSACRRDAEMALLCVTQVYVLLRVQTKVLPMDALRTLRAADERIRFDDHFRGLLAGALDDMSRPLEPIVLKDEPDEQEDDEDASAINQQLLNEVERMVQAELQEDERRREEPVARKKRPKRRMGPNMLGSRRAQNSNLTTVHLIRQHVATHQGDPSQRASSPSGSPTRSPPLTRTPSQQMLSQNPSARAAAAATAFVQQQHSHHHAADFPPRPRPMPGPTLRISAPASSGSLPPRPAPSRTTPTPTATQFATVINLHPAVSLPSSSSFNSGMRPQSYPARAVVPSRPSLQRSPSERLAAAPEGDAAARPSYVSAVPLLRSAPVSAASSSAATPHSRAQPWFNNPSGPPVPRVHDLPAIAPLRPTPRVDRIPSPHLAPLPKQDQRVVPVIPAAAD